MFKKKHTIDTLFVVMIYGMFTLLSLILVLIGVQVYSGVVNEFETRSTTRVAMYYISNKIRSTDISNNLKIEKIDGTDVLINTSGKAYQTIFYNHDGVIKRLSKYETEPFIPESGDVFSEEDIDVQSYVIAKRDKFNDIYLVDTGGNMISLFYLSTDMKTDNISKTEIDGYKAVVRSRIPQTLIYNHNGVLREAVKYDDEVFTPGDGIPLINVEDFSMWEEDGCFVIKPSVSGEVPNMYISKNK